MAQKHIKLKFPTLVTITKTPNKNKRIELFAREMAQNFARARFVPGTQQISANLSSSSILVALPRKQIDFGEN